MSRTMVERMGDGAGRALEATRLWNAGKGEGFPSMSEVGRAMGCSRNAVSGLLRRARRAGVEVRRVVMGDNRFGRVRYGSRASRDRRARHVVAVWLNHRRGVSDAAIARSLGMPFARFVRARTRGLILEAEAARSDAAAGEALLSQAA
jgi:hypothetical protein